MKIPTTLCSLEPKGKERGSLVRQNTLDKSHSPVARHHRRHRGPNPPHAARANRGNQIPPAPQCSHRAPSLLFGGGHSGRVGMGVSGSSANGEQIATTWGREGGAGEPTWMLGADFSLPLVPALVERQEEWGRMRTCPSGLGQSVPGVRPPAPPRVPHRVNTWAYLQG